MKKKKVVNLISGGGTTNLEVLKAEQTGGKLSKYSRTVAIVSSDPDAGGIKKALDLGFPKKRIFVLNRLQKIWLFVLTKSLITFNQIFSISSDGCPLPRSKD